MAKKISGNWEMTQTLSGKWETKSKWEVGQVLKISGKELKIKWERYIKALIFQFLGGLTFSAPFFANFSRATRTISTNSNFCTKPFWYICTFHIIKLHFMDNMSLCECNTMIFAIWWYENKTDICVFVTFREKLKTVYFVVD